MFADLKPYPRQAKGEVPSHWTCLRLGAVGRLFRGNGGPREDDAEYGVPCIRYGDLYTRYNIVIRHAARYVHQDQAPVYTRLQHGDLLFAASGETVEDIGTAAVNLISESDVLCGGDLVILRPTIDIEPVFLSFAVNTPSARLHKASHATGTMIVHVDAGALKNIHLALPPRAEQIAIVKYLAQANARIDRAISAKRKMIALLEERKQAIINRVVLSGLDTKAVLKDTGFPVLGVVPTHWRAPMLGRCLHRIEQGWSPSAAEGDLAADQWAVLSLSSIDRGRFNAEAVKPIPLDLDIPTKYEIKDGDLLLTRSNTRDRVGDVAVVAGSRPRTIISDLIYRLVLDRRIVSPGYMAAVLASSAGRYQIERNARGSSNTMPKISQNHIESWRVPIPPLAEQVEIVNAITENSSDINRAMGRVRSEIELLWEFRTRLAADVVTGQLDVREIASRLPDTDPEGVAENVSADIDDLNAEAAEFLEDAET